MSTSESSFSFCSWDSVGLFCVVGGPLRRRPVCLSTDLGERLGIRGFLIVLLTFEEVTVLMFLYSSLVFMSKPGVSVSMVIW